MTAKATSLAEIAERIKNMKFRPRLFGGVDEEDVWEKIRQLDADYQNLFKLQNKIFKMELTRLKGTKPKSKPKNSRQA